MNNLKIFFDDYFKKYSRALSFPDIQEQLIKMREVLVQANKQGRMIFFAGNGASASIASHCALDYTKQAGIKSMCFNEAALLTAFSNDYGYEHWLEKALAFYADEGDVAVLISSSGKSPNIINGAKYAGSHNINVITFSGKDIDNPLKALGGINLWVNSQAYNIIENVHSFWLSAVCDSIIGKAEYSVSS
jgi:D-sedoheptulose 7-phosphate isomerase